MRRSIGAINADVSRPKDLADYWLTRFPKLYLALEKRRQWLCWDRRLYLAVVQPGNIVLDIGANVGAHTVLFSHLVGREGTVLSFEPVPDNVTRLRATVARRSRSDNVTIRELAVGHPRSTREQITLTAPGDDLTQASMAIQTAGSWEHGTGVRRYSATLTSIDTELAATPLSRLDFVKIDVEGAELDVLRGGANTIARFQPLIYAEVFADWTRSFGYSPADLFEYIRAAGYTDARVIRGELATALPLDGIGSVPDFDVSSNVLFFGDRHRALVQRFDRLFDVQTRFKRNGD